MNLRHTGITALTIAAQALRVADHIQETELKTSRHPVTVSHKGPEDPEGPRDWNPS